MGQLLDDVKYLAGEIGPRGTGTPGEEAAAIYVAKRLTNIGLVPTKHPFRTVTSQNAFPIATSLLALIAFIVFPLGFVLTHWLAVILNASAGWLLWQTIRNAFNPLNIILPKTHSQNIESRLEAKGDLRKKVVILAHLDTNHCRLIWQSLSINILESMTWLTLAVPYCMSLLYLSSSFLGVYLSWLLSFPFAAYELGTIITLIRDDLTPYSPGAHDNAASIAVTLELARDFVHKPLKNTQIWFIFDGGEETDHAGTQDLLRRHRSELQEAFFIGLEGLGSCELVYLTRQGVCAFYRPTPYMLALAESVSLKHPEFKFKPAQMVAEDDVRTLRGRGYHAIGIAGYDPQTGILPHWHRPDDTPDSVSEETMHRAVDILRAFLEELDEKVEQI